MGLNTSATAIGTPAVAVTGTPTSGQVPTATGPAAATWQTPSSSLALPVWTYVAGGGAPAGGKVTANNANIESTTLIRLSATEKNGAAAIISVLNFAGAGQLYFTNTSTGKTITLGFSSGADNTNEVQLTVSIDCAETGAWSGDYALSFGRPTVASVNGKTGALSVTVADVETASTITPISDGAHTLPGTLSNGSFTTVQGIVTDYTAPSFI